MSNIGDFKKGLCALTPSAAASALAVINQALDLNVIRDKAAADGAAGTATADTLLWSNPFDFAVTVVGATITPTGAGVTADNTNFATITLKTNDGAGGATAIALTLTTAITDSGNLSQNQSKAFTSRTPANVVIPAGGGLWLNITKTGTGVVIPVSFFSVRLQRGE